MDAVTVMTDSPGCCAVCQRVVIGRPAVNTGAEIEFFGRIYLCEACVDDAAATLGRTRPQHVEQAVAERDELRERLAEAEEISANLAGQLEQLKHGAVEEFVAEAVRAFGARLDEQAAGE